MKRNIGKFNKNERKMIMYVLRNAPRGGGVLGHARRGRKSERIRSGEREKRRKLI